MNQNSQHLILQRLKFYGILMKKMMSILNQRICNAVRLMRMILILLMMFKMK